LVFETELSFGVCGLRTPLSFFWFDFLSLFGFAFGGAEFLTRGLAVAAFSEVALSATFSSLDGQMFDNTAVVLVAGLATTFSSFEVDDPEEQAVALMTSAITNGKDSFFSFMILLMGVA
jgi:hypothetical protein